MELVPAQHRWVDELLASCRHPLTATYMPRESQLSREDVEHFLAEAPLGRFPGDELTGRAPAYQFWMLLRHGPGGPTDRPPLRIAGGLSARFGGGPTIERYYGHLGYHVYPAARGQRYAYRASRLVLPLLRKHGLRHAWVTCDPDNHASRRTIERLGARYVETIPVPPTDPLYARGEIFKSRFLLALD